MMPSQVVQSTFKDDCGDYNNDYYYNYNCFIDAQVVQSTFRLLVKVVMVSNMIVVIMMTMMTVIMVMSDYRR